MTLTPAAKSDVSHSVYAGSDGAFYFNGVPYGNYTLNVWNAQNQSIRSLTIAVTKPLVDVRDVRIP